MSDNKLWSPKYVDLRSEDYSDALLRDHNIRLRDVISYLEDAGYSSRLDSRRKQRADKQTLEHFGISEDELRICKLIAACYYPDSRLYQMNDSNNPKRPPISIMIDENLSYKIALDFMTQGLRVSSVYFDDLMHKPDSEIWSAGPNIIVTTDRDFINLAEMFYLQRCIERGTQYVDTSDLPFVVCLAKNDFNKAVMLPAIRRLIPTIIDQMNVAPRRFLYGEMRPSGFFELVSHSTVFDNRITFPNAYAERLGYVWEFDGRVRLIQASTAKQFGVVANKARFTAEEVEAIVSYNPNEISPFDVFMAREKNPGNVMVNPLPELVNVADRSEWPVALIPHRTVARDLRIAA